MKNIHKPEFPIRLYWGENYAPKAPVVQRALGRAFSMAQKISHLYPGELQEQTKQALASAYHIHANQILIGAGIEGILKDCFKMWVGPGDSVLTIAPTFGGYEHNAVACGASVITIPVSLSTKLTAQEVLSVITPKTKLLIFASPNTSTGAYHLAIEDYKEMLPRFPGLVVVDECYYHIGKKTVLPLLKKYDNLLVLRSASKSWGLAGVRVGFAFGSSVLIDQLNKQTIMLAPDPLPGISYKALQAILPYRQMTADAYVAFRNTFAQRLVSISHFIVYPSDTTFIPVAVPHPEKLPIFLAQMAAQGVLLKDTAQLGYLLIGVPPKDAWGYVLDCFQESSALLS